MTLSVAVTVSARYPLQPEALQGQVQLPGTPVRPKALGTRTSIESMALCVTVALQAPHESSNALH